MTRREALDLIRRTQTFMADPRQTDAVVRLVVAAQLRSLSAGLEAGGPEPIADILDWVTATQA